MTLKQYLFEGGTQGTNLTTANTGALEVVTNGGAITFDSSVAAHGTMGAKFVSTSNANSVVSFVPDTITNQLSGSFVVTLPAAIDTNSLSMLRIENGSGGGVLQLSLYGSVMGGQSGRLALIGSGGSYLGALAEASDLALGSKYRFDFVITGGSTTSGIINANLYDQTTGAQVGSTVASTTANLSATPPAKVQIGITTTSNSAGIVLGYDDLQLNDGGTVPPAPISGTPPNVTVTPNQNLAAAATATVTATASDTDGSIASYAWSVVGDHSTATPTLSGGSTATCTFTTPAAGNLVTVQCTVTDSDGLTATVTTEVRVPTTGNATTLALDYGANSAWTKIGGASSKGASLADSSDSTGSQSPSYTSTETEERYRLQPMSARAGLSLTPRSVVTATGGTTKFRLYEGNTLRQEWTLTQATTAAAQTCNVSAPGAIVDWGNLWVAAAAVL